MGEGLFVVRGFWFGVEESEDFLLQIDECADTDSSDSSYDDSLDDVLLVHLDSLDLIGFT